MYGNHDDLWMDARAVAKYLVPRLGSIDVREAFRYEVTWNGRVLGELYLVHGHQGTWDSDRHRGLSRWVVRNVWRPFQRLTRAGRATPATDACLRARHDEAMYSWASRRGVILVAGHTHRPVWSSRTHLQKLEAELAAWRSIPEAERPADWTIRLAELEAAVAERAAKFPP